MILNGTIALPKTPLMIDMSQDFNADCWTLEDKQSADTKGTTQILKNITVDADNKVIKFTIYYSDKGYSKAQTVYQNGAWNADVWRQFEFTNQEVSEEFYWWVNNKAKLNGIYVFNKYIYVGLSGHEENVQFISNGKNYSKMRVYGFPEVYYDDDFVYVLGGDWKLGEEYRTATFDNQYVSADFYNWFMSNAILEEVYTIRKSTLKEIADAIRSKRGTIAAIPVTEFAAEIKNI